jgi:fumarate reductase flavoprotein subunit
MKRDYDVIVIGSGGAGMSAAISAHEAGASVLLVEADSHMGGSTSLSGGVVYAAGTSVQRAIGVLDDSADAMFEYYMTLNQWRVEPALARILCDQSGPAVEWLIELGVEFRPAGLYASGVESVPRGHSAAGMGAAIASALEQAVGTRGIEVVLNTRVDSLLEDKNGVGGVGAGGQDVRSGAVVIATGGFGQNPAMLHRYYPDAAAHGDWTWSISARHCKGDGLKLAERAGAAIVGHNRGLLLTTPGFSKDLEVYVPGWIVYVNREGRRFVNEMAAYAVMSGVVREQTGGSCFAIFDEETRAQAEPDSVYADAFAGGALPLNWVHSVLAEQAEKGKVLKGEGAEGRLLQRARRAGWHSARCPPHDGRAVQPRLRAGTRYGVLQDGVGNATHPQATLLRCGDPPCDRLPDLDGCANRHAVPSPG